MLVGNKNSLWSKKIDYIDNTHIGGVGVSVTSKSDLATLLGISESTIKSFNTDGTNVSAYINSSYILNFQILKLNTEITYFEDLEAKVTYVDREAFSRCNNLEYVTFTGLTLPLIGIYQTFYVCSKLNSININIPYTSFELGFARACSLFSINSLNISNVTNISQDAFRDTNVNGSLNLPECISIGYGAFYSAKIIGALNLPKCTSIDAYGFYNNTSITSINAPLLEVIDTLTFSGLSVINYNLPELTTINGNFSFINNFSVETIYMPKCTKIGDTIGDNEVFKDIKLGCTITVDASLETVNGGLPDGDLVYARDVRGATIIYV